MRSKNMFSSSNPMFGEKMYQDPTLVPSDITGSNMMTVQGAINKTLMLFGLLLATSLVGYMFPNPLFIWGGAIGGLIVVIISVFKKDKSPILAPLYAALEGLFVGGISYMYASMMNGIILQAVTLTFALLFLMLFIYKTGIIKVTNKFRVGVVMATGAVLMVYVLSWILGMFGINIPFLHEGGMMGIGISLVIIGIACMNLLLDFDNFEKGEEHQMPRYMEWFFAMGLIITLVWLYLEILRLLSKFSSRN